MRNSFSKWVEIIVGIIIIIFFLLMVSCSTNINKKYEETIIILENKEKVLNSKLDSLNPNRNIDSLMYHYDSYNVY